MVLLSLVNTVKWDECTGLLLYYNELRDEYFAELRYKSYPEIDHH